MRSIRRLAVGLGLLALLQAAPASAELAISQLIVELKPGASRAADIEIYNDSEERSFVSVEPRELVDVGLDREKPRHAPDPEQLGLLVSPRRLVLEPGQRRRLRIGAIGPVPVRERVYRVTIKPVSGEVKGSETGLKLLVGYDLLVLVRPQATKPRLDVVRNGNALTITNQGDASVELAWGKQCNENGQDCRLLPNKRLYSGVSWRQLLPAPTNGEYRVRSAEGWTTLQF